MEDIFLGVDPLKQSQNNIPVNDIFADGKPELPKPNPLVAFKDWYLDKLKDRASSIANIPSAINSGLTSMIQNAPTAIPGAVKNLVTDPKRFGENLLFGAAGNPILGVIGNTVNDVNDLRTRINPNDPENENRQPIDLPQVARTAMMGAPQAGDQLTQNLPLTALLTKGALNLTSKGLDKIDEKLAPKVAPEITNKESEIALAEQQHQKLVADAKASQENLDSSKAIAQQTLGKNSPNAMIYERESKIPTIDENKNIISQSQRDLNNLEKPNTTTENAQAVVDHHQDKLDELNNQLTEHKADLDQHLDVGTNHGVDLAVQLQNELGNLKDTAAHNYKGFEAGIKDMPIRLGSEGNKTLNDELLRLQKNPSPNLNMLLSKVPNTALPAEKYFTRLKDFRDARYKIMQNLRADTPLNQEERRQAWKDTQPLYDFYENKLKEAVGPKLAKQYQENATNYSHVIFPLEDNSIMAKAQKGTVGPNIIGDLSKSPGEDEALGQHLVNTIARDNPDIVKNILGQVYKKKTNGSLLYNPDSQTQEWLNLHPETAAKVNEGNQIQAQIYHHENALDSAKSDFKTAKDYETKSEKFRQDISDAHAKMNETQKRIDELNKHIPELQNKAREKKQSLYQKTQSEKKILELKDELKQLKVDLPLKESQLYKLYKGWREHKTAGTLLGIGAYKLAKLAVGKGNNNINNNPYVGALGSLGPP